MADFRVKLEKLSADDFLELARKHDNLGSILQELGYTRSGPMYARLKALADSHGVTLPGRGVPGPKTLKVGKRPRMDISTSLLPTKPPRQSSLSITFPNEALEDDTEDFEADTENPPEGGYIYQAVIDQLDSEMADLEDQIFKRQEVIAQLKALG